MKKLLNFNEFVNESINEGAVKQFEMGVSSLINNIKSGYGWIDPSYVFDTFNQSDEFYGIDWDNVKGEIFQRLIDNGLLYYSSDTDPEQQGRKVTSVKQIQESVNEATILEANNTGHYHTLVFYKGENIAMIFSSKNPEEFGPNKGMYTTSEKYTNLTSEEVKNMFPEFMKEFRLRKQTDLAKEVISGRHVLESVNEAARVPSNVLEFAKRKGSYATALVKKAAGWAEKAGKYISNGTAIGKNYSTIILDMKHHGSEIYINLDDETIELFGEPVTDAKSFAKVLATNESVEVNEGGKDEQVKKECISRLSDFFRVTPNSLSKFNFDGKDNIKELTRALNSTSDQGTELYYQTAIKSVKRDLGVNESEVNEDMGKFVSGTLNTPFDTLKIGDVIKLDALDYTRRGDMDKITCVLPDGNKAEILKKHITVKL
jgi:hypothetical protein